jgi:hypothetical protein
MQVQLKFQNNARNLVCLSIKGGMTRSVGSLVLACDMCVACSYAQGDHDSQRTTLHLMFGGF